MTLIFITYLFRIHGMNEAMSKPEKFFEDSIMNLCESKKLDPEKDICGFMLETFQGWGSIFYPKDFCKSYF